MATPRRSLIPDDADLVDALLAADPRARARRRFHTAGQVEALHGDRADVRVGFDAAEQPLVLAEVPVQSGFRPAVGDWVRLAYPNDDPAAALVDGPTVTQSTDAPDGGVPAIVDQTQVKPDAVEADAYTPPAGHLRDNLDHLRQVIKDLKGTVAWITTPPATLQEARAHIDDLNNPHLTTLQQVTDQGNVTTQGVRVRGLLVASGGAIVNDALNVNNPTAMETVAAGHLLAGVAGRRLHYSPSTDVLHFVVEAATQAPELRMSTRDAAAALRTHGRFVAYSASHGSGRGDEVWFINSINDDMVFATNNAEGARLTAAHGLIINNPSAPIAPVAAGDLLAGGAASQLQYDESGVEVRLNTAGTVAFITAMATGASSTAGFRMRDGAKTWDWKVAKGQSSAVILRESGAGDWLLVQPAGNVRIPVSLTVGANAAPTASMVADVIGHFRGSANAWLNMAYVSDYASSGGYRGTMANEAQSIKSKFFAGWLAGDAAPRVVITRDTIAFGDGTFDPWNDASGASAIKITRLPIGTGFRADYFAPKGHNFIADVYPDTHLGEQLGRNAEFGSSARKYWDAVLVRQVQFDDLDTATPEDNLQLFLKCDAPGQTPGTLFHDFTGGKTLKYTGLYIKVGTTVYAIPAIVDTGVTPPGAPGVPA